MKFSKGKVAVLALAGIVALGGVGGALAWTITDNVAPGTGAVVTDSAIEMKFDGTQTDINAKVTIDPYGTVRKKVTVYGNKSEGLDDVGHITFTFAGGEAQEADNVRIRLTDDVDYNVGSNVKAVLGKTADPESGVVTSVTYDFNLDNTKTTYYIEFSYLNATAASKTLSTTNLGNLKISLSNVK